MSAETASTGGPRPSTAQPERAPRALRALALAAVAVGLAALAAGTFILSYSGIHALALHAGIAPRLARGYPLLIDAMLVIVLAAVLALRGADLPSRVLAWVTLLAVLAAAAGADALHAAGRKLPGHVAAITAAVLPWVLVFLAFALLLAMLRHARLRRLAATRRRPAPGSDTMAWLLPDAPHGGMQPGGMAAAAASPAGTDLQEPELAVDAEPEPDDPSSDEGVPDLVDEAAHADQAGQADQAGDQNERDDPDMPVFHRMWSSPTPPEPRA